MTRRPPPVPELPPRQAYDLWAATYAPLEIGRAGADGTPNPIVGAADRALLATLAHAAAQAGSSPASGPPNLIAGRDVLDIACGPGRRFAWLASTGARRVVGMDLSGAMAARAHAGGWPVAVADMRDLPFAPASFDLAIHVLALGHVPDPRPALAACARALRAGGLLALVDLHPNFARFGWQRTFRDARGELHAVAWWPHDPDDLASLCTELGLTVIRSASGAAWQGQSLGAAERPNGPRSRDDADPNGPPIVYGLAAIS